MLRFGPEKGPVVVAAPALFEEANRTRAFLVRILRLLAEGGVASVLPDLPGQGESLAPLEGVRLEHWRHAFRAAIELVAAKRDVIGTVSIRGGALVEALAPVRARWRFAPQSGEEVGRELSRMTTASSLGRSAHIAIGADARAQVVEIAGNRIGIDLLADLRIAVPPDTKTGPPSRVVRLDIDPRPADRKLPGPPLWRRSEPDLDEALADALADDIVAWVQCCAA